MDMNSILDFIQANIQMAPFLIFGLLLLAGFNLPVSEDGMLFISALMAAKNPEYKYALFFGVFAGAYFSDIICYTMGRTVGVKLLSLKFFSKMISKEKLAKIEAFYTKYGVLTLILGRFIPFGVRNGLFLSAGFSKMNFLKFALSDLLACTISSIVFFYLYYTFGEVVVEYVKKFNVIIISIALASLSAYFLKKKFIKKSN